MDHVAIMKSSWGLTPRILSGEKSIESRWYMTKRPPWGKVKAGDNVYFKDSGRPVGLVSRVSGVKLIPNLSPSRVSSLLKRYGAEDGLKRNEIPKFYRQFKGKKYCMLVFLKGSRRVRPFLIDKSGFGMMSAWITVNNINRIRIREAVK